jgi:predicted NodU family carbamoyl transferase
VSFVLGMNDYHGDPAAALLRHGERLGPVEEERCHRIHPWASIPTQSGECLIRPVTPASVGGVG